MEIYIVTIEGIQCTYIYGIYDSKELADSAAKEAKQRERDDYHSIIIIERNMNVSGCDNIINSMVFFEGYS